MLRATVTLVPALLLVGCAADNGDQGMLVLNNTAVQDTCQLTGDPNAPFISHGMISTVTTLPYELTPLIQSRIAATGTNDLQRTIQLQGANISLEVKSASIQHADGSFATPTISLTGTEAQFSSLFSASLPPDGTVNVGFDLVPLQAIASIVQQAGAGETDHLHVEVLATATIYGDLAGSKVEAQPFQFPVTVCNDCVVVNNGACPLTITSARTGNACNPFQDGTVDCCVDASNVLVCPGPTQ